MHGADVSSLTKQPTPAPVHLRITWYSAYNQPIWPRTQATFAYYTANVPATVRQEEVGCVKARCYTLPGLSTPSGRSAHGMATGHAERVLYSLPRTLSPLPCPTVIDTRPWLRASNDSSSSIQQYGR